MRLNINKASDLNSISVLPPHSRRQNASSSGMDSSVMRMNQPSMHRSQSQQSFSQGMSLSQLSQSSFDEILTNEQRLGSEDQPSKRISCLAPTRSTREEPRLQLIRSANDVVPRWKSSSTSEQACRVSEDLDHRIGSIETSLIRLGRLLDSIQCDVMQVNKTVKELTLETEGIKQKVTAQDHSIQLIMKGEDDIKASLDKSLKSTERMKKESEDNKFDDITSVLLALPDQIESRVLSLQNEVFEIFMKEVKEISSSLKSPHSNQLLPAKPDIASSLKCHTNKSFPAKSIRKIHDVTQFQENQPVPIHLSVPSKTVNSRSAPVQKDEKYYSKLQKTLPFIKKRQKFVSKQEAISFSEREQDFRIIVDSDEEIDVGFSCLLKGKGTGMASYFSEDIKEQTTRILRKARRKRKFCNIVIID